MSPKKGNQKKKVNKNNRTVTVRGQTSDQTKSLIVVFREYDFKEQSTFISVTPVSVKKHKYIFYVLFNPLSPKSDQDQFSPNNINTSSKEKYMRNSKTTNWKKIQKIFKQILSINYSRKCMMVSVENL